MAEKPKTALNDPDNVFMVEVVEEDQGFTVEDAYRVLADMPPEPVVEPEE
jgi:hypothetical protein